MTIVSSGVESTSTQYDANARKWRLNRLLETSDIILPDAWKQHLYYPQRWDVSDLARQRQREFINGAVLFPALKRTLDGSLGVVFRKPTKMQLSSNLEYMRDNVDGNNKGLEQLIQDVTLENILQGYGGMLVDFADNRSSESRAQDMLFGNSATIQLYTAENITNVYLVKVGANSFVQQIVLEEEYEAREGQFTVERKTQYRVLLLDEFGLYKQQVYRTGRGSEDGIIEEYMPTDVNGNRLNYIPFAFFGAKCNDWRVDASPLYPMSLMNAHHLEYSALRNESIRQLAPTLIINQGEGFDPEVFSAENPGGVVMGAYNAYNFGKGGGASILQAAANDAANQEMLHLEDLMVQAGALLIKGSSSNVSTDTTIIQRSTDTSVLGVAVRNVEDAFNKCLTWAADFMGGPGDSKVDINREFFATPMTANDRQRWAEDVQAGLVSNSEYREAMNKAGLLPDSAMDQNEILGPDDNKEQPTGSVE